MSKLSKIEDSKLYVYYNSKYFYNHYKSVVLKKVSSENNSIDPMTVNWNKSRLNKKFNIGG